MFNGLMKIIRLISWNVWGVGNEIVPQTQSYEYTHKQTVKGYFIQQETNFLDVAIYRVRRVEINKFSAHLEHSKEQHKTMKITFPKS